MDTGINRASTRRGKDRPLVSTMAGIALFAQIACGGTPEPETVATTKLEGFRSEAGTIVTLGYDKLGQVNDILVNVHELRDSRGNVVRGLVVKVPGATRYEEAFIDADEISELLRGIDVLLGISANPTPFSDFTIRYTTRGELQVVAYSERDGIRYLVEAGRVTRAQSFLYRADLVRLQAIIAAGQERITAVDTVAPR